MLVPFIILLYNLYTVSYLYLYLYNAFTLVSVFLSFEVLGLEQIQALLATNSAFFYYYKKARETRALSQV